MQILDKSRHLLLTSSGAWEWLSLSQLSYQFRLYRNDLTAKARRTRSSRRESLIQDDEERILDRGLANRDKLIAS